MELTFTVVYIETHSYFKISIMDLLFYLTNRFHVAMRLYSGNRSQMMSKCGKNKNMLHEAPTQIS